MSRPIVVPSRRRTSRSSVAVAMLVALVLSMLPVALAPVPAGAAAALTVTPITFDVIGLDSNAVTSGPNLFPVGARACNTGDVTLTAATATLVFEGAINPYLTVSGPSTFVFGTLAPGECRDVYFNVAITRTSAAYDTFQRYYIQVTTDQGVTARTPQPRQLYIESLVSQNRNSVVSLTGPTTVYVGETYTYTLTAKTATQGYEQLESFLTLDGVIFQIISTTSTYSAPAGATNDKLYANACGLQLDPTLANYRECVGPDQYAGGKAGGNITVTYVVKVLSTGPTSLVPLIYDMSGASYHYNSDFGAITGKAITAMPASADLSVTKSASNASPTLGSDVTFTVGLANAGPTPASGVQVKDLLPAGLTYVSHTAPSGTTYDPATGIWAVPSIAIGASTNLLVTATVTGGGTLVNTAEVVASSVPDPDSAVNNGVATEDDQASATLTPPRADLSLTKTVNDPAPNVGQQVTYTVTVTNSGPATPATNVQVSDVLPAGLSFVSASAGSYDAISGMWTVGSVAVGTPRTLSIVATVNAAGPITNVAQVQAADQLDPDSTAANSNPAEDDQASVTVSALQADVSVTKTASTLTPNVGANVTFTIGVANGGPNTATNLTVTDPLPTGLALVSATPSQGSYSSVTGAWFVGSVAGGGSATLTIVAQVSASTPVVNTAQVQSVDQFDPDGTDNSATVTVTPQRADLSLTKSASTTSPNVGDTMTFTVAVTNSATSNAAATNLVVADAVPSGTSFVSASATSGSYASGTGLWTVGSVPAGATATLTVTVVVTGATAFTNTAAVQSVDQFDPDSTPGNGAAAEDDQASVAVSPQRADLSVALSVDDPSPNVGDQVVFTVTLANAGTSDATGVTVDVTLPAGLTFVSSTATGGTFDGSTGVWTVGGVPSGGSVELQVTATVSAAGAQTVVASVATADQFDPDSTPGNALAEDDLASVAATPQQADLSVTALAGAATVPVGSQTTFTFSVTNGGPGVATGVAVAAAVPAGSTFVSATPSSGTYDPVGGLWTPGDLASGATATLTVTVTITNPGPVTATAEVVAADQHDPDSTPANGASVPAEDDFASASVVGVQADLSLTKVVSAATPNVGDLVTFTLTVTNGGPSVATGVSVLDQLPTGLTFESNAASHGSYAPGTGLWTVGTVPVGGSATLTITARVTSSATTTNTAEVWTSDLPDPDSTPANGAAGAGEDDRATATVTPRIADLSLSLTVVDDRPNVGDDASFTVTLANIGPDGATGVTVLVPLPAGYGTVTATPSQGSYDAATGLWTVGAVAVGAAPTLVLEAAVTSATATVVTGQVQASAVFDPDSTPANGAVTPAEDDLASVGVTPLAADLRLAKTVVGSAAVDLGDDVTFTITLTNDGPDAATSVTVTDVLPAGLTYASSVPGSGTTYSGATGVWSVPSLASGASISLALTATVTTGPLTNVAAVSGVDQFDPDSTPGSPSPSSAEDDTAAATVTGRAADLRIAKTAPASVAAGQPVSYTIAVTNDGPSDAVDVVITDVLPPALLTPSTSSPGCSIAAGTMTCALGAMTVGETRVVTLSGTAPATGDLSNTATVSSATPDTDPSDDSSTVVVAVADVADLRLAKSGPATVLAGEGVAYTLTVTNDGPSTGTGLVVSDPLPAGLGSPSTSSPGCSITASSGAFTFSCAIASLAAGASVSVSVSGTAPADPGSLVNTASVSSATVDPDASDDSATATTAVTAKADLSVTKSAPLSVVAGGALTYLIGVANAGPSTAEDVVVTDGLPAGFESASTSSPGCVVGPGSVLTCNLGDLAAGASLSVSVTGSSASSGTAATLTNTVSVSSTTFDPDPSDDASTATSAIVPTLVVGDVSVVEGGVATVPITLSNPSTGDVVLTISTVDGSAVAGGGDYVARSGVVVTIPAGSVSGSFVVSTSGDPTDEPDEAFNAVVGSGSVTGAVVADGTGVVTILDDDNTVQAVDDAVTTDEDVAVTVAVLANDLDLDGDTPLVLVAVTQPSIVGFGSVVANPDGTVTFIPAHDANGTVTFTYTVRDQRGATDTATVTVVVTPVDDPPVASPDRYAVPANATSEQPAVDGVLVNDTDVDADALSAVLVAGPVHGVLTFRPDGSFSYRPDADFSGTDTFTYRAVGAGASSPPVTVTLDVGPVALADAYVTGEGITLVVPAGTGALANDRVGGGQGTAVLVSAPARGTLALATDGSFTYVPAAGTTGTDTFTYRTCVADACSVPATVTITITPAPLAPPVATDDAVTADEDGAVIIPVLTNDTDPDAALDPGRVSVVAAPAHGVATVLPSGQIRYVADDGFSGLDTFTYRICDVAGQCDDAVVRITVQGRVVHVPELPRTGAPLGALGGLAAALLLAGAVLVVAARTKIRDGALTAV